jgi:hypothetical protein
MGNESGYQGNNIKYYSLMLNYNQQLTYQFLSAFLFPQVHNALGGGVHE